MTFRLSLAKKIASVLLLHLLLSATALGADSATVMQRVLADFGPAQLFPGADRIGEPDGEYLISEVYQQDQKIGLLFLIVFPMK